MIDGVAFGFQRFFGKGGAHGNYFLIGAICELL